MSASSPTPPQGARRAGEVYAGPSAFRLARELGVAIERVPASASSGRVSCSDIKLFVKQGNQIKTTFQAPPASRLEETGSVARREPLSGIAATTAANMARIWERIPHAWLQVNVDISDLEKLRKSWNDSAHEKLSLSAFLIGALAETLKKFPKFNACYDEAAGELIYQGEINIGLAVDTPRGLLVPVIRRADRLSIGKIAAQINEFARAGRSNRLSPEHLRGGGMTLSSLGGMKIDSLFPLVNWPEVAILGAGTTRIEPVWDGQKFAPRSTLNLVLGFDHRVINGADGARFLDQLQQVLVNPILLIR